MSAQTAVIMSLGIAFAGLAYYGFKMMESEQPIIGVLGTLFISLALGLLQVVVWVGLEIANAAAMTTVVSGATTPVLWIVMLSVFLFWLGLFIKAIYQLVALCVDYVGNTFGRMKADE